MEFTENEWTGVRIEEIECFRVEERSNSGHSFGLVEEYSESEVKANKLFVNRGLSIVSLSDDERSLSRNNSLNEMDEIDSNDEANCGDEGPGPQKGSETEAPEGKKAVETSAEIPKFGQMNEGQSEEPEVKQNRMPAESEPANDECDGEDADMNNLLQRIKQQRSVLEDILNKENEYNKEGTFK